MRILQVSAADSLEQLPQKRIAFRHFAGGICTTEWLVALMINPCGKEAIRQRLGKHVRKRRFGQVRDERLAEGFIQVKEPFHHSSRNVTSAEAPPTAKVLKVMSRTRWVIFAIRKANSFGERMGSGSRVRKLSSSNPT